MYPDKISGNISIFIIEESLRRKIGQQEIGYFFAVNPEIGFIAHIY